MIIIPLNKWTLGTILFGIILILVLDFSVPEEGINNEPLTGNQDPSFINQAFSEPKYNETWLESRIHELTNIERSNNGRSKLLYDEKLAEIAQKHSEDMVRRNFFEHDNLDRQDPTDRANRAGYDCTKDFGDYYTEGVAENIAGDHIGEYVYESGSIAEYKTPEEIAKSVVSGWMNSPGHRENILDSAYDREGIGVAIAANGEVLVTQNFC